MYLFLYDEIIIILRARNAVHKNLKAKIIEVDKFDNNKNVDFISIL